MLKFLDVFFLIFSSSILPSDSLLEGAFLAINIKEGLIPERAESSYFGTHIIIHCPRNLAH